MTARQVQKDKKTISEFSFNFSWGKRCKNDFYVFGQLDEKNMVWLKESNCELKNVSKVDCFDGNVLMCLFDFIWNYEFMNNIYVVFEKCFVLCMKLPAETHSSSHEMRLLHFK